MTIPGRWVVLIAFVAFRVGAPEPAAATVPPEWTCDPDYYDTDDGCDCGCGALDPDCEDGTVDSCDDCNDEDACSDSEDCSDINPTENWLCRPSVPAEWTCDPDYYGTDDGCDCGCGTLDPDCTNATVGSCEYCGEDGACDAGSEDCSTINPTQNSLCGAPQAPAPAMSMPGLVFVALLLTGFGVLGLSRRRMRFSGKFR